MPVALDARLPEGAEFDLGEAKLEELATIVQMPARLPCASASKDERSACNVSLSTSAWASMDINTSVSLRNGLPPEFAETQWRAWRQQNRPY